MKLFDLWVEKGRPCPPFFVYFTPTSEHPAMVETVIFHFQRLPENENEVSFFEQDDSSFTKGADWHSIHVEHDRFYK